MATDTRTPSVSMPLFVALLELVGAALIVGGLTVALGWAGIALAAGVLLIVVAIGIERRELGL